MFHFIFDYNFGNFFYNFYTIGNRNEYFTIIYNLLTKCLMTS